MNIVTGDIGGTNARLRLFTAVSDGWQLMHKRRRPSRDFDSLEDAVGTFLNELSPAERLGIAGACLAVAGPVRDGEARFTNLPWRTDEANLAAHLQLPAVRLINDLEALAHGIDTLRGGDSVTLRHGRASGDRSLVIAAGTGLGMNLRWRRNGATQVFASEGGHVDFAPTDEEQIALLQSLLAERDHVGYEDLLSGRGLRALYGFVCARRGACVARSVSEARDPAAAITALAYRDGDAAADAALGLFARILAAFAGNAALQWLAFGGVYLAGGVLAHLQSHLLAEDFARCFTAKGTMSRLVAPLPIRLVTDDDAGLNGALWVAERTWRAHRPSVRIA